MGGAYPNLGSALAGARASALDMLDCAHASVYKDGQSIFFSSFLENITFLSESRADSAHQQHSLFQKRNWPVAREIAHENKSSHCQNKGGNCRNKGGNCRKKAEIAGTNNSKLQNWFWLTFAPYFSFQIGPSN